MEYNEDLQFDPIIPEPEEAQVPQLPEETPEIIPEAFEVPAEPEETDEPIEYPAEPEPIPEPERPTPIVHRMVRDVRFFLNTLDKAVGVMQDSGVGAKVEREELDDGLLVRILIPNARV